MTPSRPNLIAGRCASSAGLRGSTLTEVLMSILVMSIGIISVATMFPLSMLRSIQANQLTASTILRYNAESQIDSNPLMIFDPNDDWNPALGLADFETNKLITDHRNTKYIVDPLGYYYQSTTLQGYFGNDGAGAANKTLTRFPGFAIARTFSPYPDQDGNGTPGTTDDALALARSKVTLPDTWKNELEAQATTIDSDRKVLTLASPVDLARIKDMLAPADGKRIVQVRAIVFDAEGTQSQARVLTAADANATAPTITWNDALPARIGTPGKVRIDVQEAKYTWMLTVRRQPLGKADVDVVIFDKRSFSAEDEQVYSRTTSKPVFTSDPKTADKAHVQFPSDKRPHLKKGGYVLDVAQARWYRIQGIREVDAGGGKIEAELQLNQPASGNGNAAIFLPGIVDVYPIGSKSP